IIIGVGTAAGIRFQDRSPNNYGFFSLTLPAGTYTLISSYIGFASDTQTVVLDRNRTLSLDMAEKPSTVGEVVISAAKDAYEREVKSPQMSQIHLDAKRLNMIPTIAGEPDLMKVVQLLPGVTKGGEGTTSILVRGGDPDQNLILLDEAVVYNVSHLFGFFSVFNPDALKDLTVIKGGFPAQYGGRLSSVLDITMNEGNLKEYHIKGGIGILSSRLTVEGPIVKNKGSFSVSGRRTYLDRVLGVFGVQVPYYFYDVNAKANYKLNEKNRLYFSTYLGDDVLSAPELDEEEEDPENPLGETDFGFRLGNITSTLRWNHLFSERLFSNTSAIFTRFNYNIRGQVGDNRIFVGSDVTDIGLKQDFGFYMSPVHTLRFGGQWIQHRFRPNVISAQGDISQFIEDQEVEPINASELSAYVQHEWQATDKLRVNYGARLSGSVVPNKFYGGIEPRASAVWTLNDKHSLKLGYARMVQYLHLVSSSTVALPTDLWYPVTESVKPQSAHQIAISYTRHLEGIRTLLTVESYYKRMQNLTEYREGANLILNDNFEEELLQGDGEAYGWEILLKRDEGRLNGWIGYTLAFSKRFFEELNGGEAFWSKYDRRHDLAAVAIFNLTDRLNVSGVYTYLSGSRFTPQIGQYLAPNPALTGVELIPIFAARNSVRLTGTNRVDLSLAFRNKLRKRLKSEWVLSVY
ncbi:MAG: TonB-dependent receptor, partial [Bacteroidota bacterium]